MSASDERAARARALRDRGPLLSLGLMAADPMRLGEELASMRRLGVDTVHLDIGDGRFCPLLLGGTPIVAAVPASVTKDVHLMVADPLAQLEAVVAAGAGIVTTHVEATAHPHRVLRALAGMEGPAGPVLRGVALNPGTPIGSVEPLLGELELVLVLAVDPGWRESQGQQATAERLRAVRDLARASGRGDVLISVVGGIDAQAAETLARAGADLVVAGSALFGSEDPGGAVEELVAALGRAPKAGPDRRKRDGKSREEQA